MSSRNPKAQAEIEAIFWFAAFAFRRFTPDQVRQYVTWSECPANRVAYAELVREAQCGPRVIQ